MKSMTRYGPISTNCSTNGVPMRTTCAIVRASSVRVASVFITIEVIKCGSHDFCRDGSKGGIFANRGARFGLGWGSL